MQEDFYDGTEKGNLLSSKRDDRYTNNRKLKVRKEQCKMVRGKIEWKCGCETDGSKWNVNVAKNCELHLPVLYTGDGELIAPSLCKYHLPLFFYYFYIPAQTKVSKVEWKQNNKNTLHWDSWQPKQRQKHSKKPNSHYSAKEIIQIYQTKLTALSLFWA